MFQEDVVGLICCDIGREFMRVDARCAGTQLERKQIAFITFPPGRGGSELPAITQGVYKYKAIRRCDVVKALAKCDQRPKIADEEVINAYIP
ncbi:hypothetical protein AE621_22455 [Acidovorax sp. SD340]|nr:hypothetical protein AE621_22455 [Acidovorax sp. SD340]